MGFLGLFFRISSGFLGISGFFGIFLNIVGVVSDNVVDVAAVDHCRKSGLTFFNPQTAGWSGRFIPTEAAAMDASRLLLFVITRETRSLSSMALASHYVGLGCNVVLCVQQLADNAVIGGESLSPAAIKDYNRGRNYLSDMANREGFPVFAEVNHTQINHNKNVKNIPKNIPKKLQIY